MAAKTKKKSKKAKAVEVRECAIPFTRSEALALMACFMKAVQHLDPPDSIVESAGAMAIRISNEAGIVWCNKCETVCYVEDCCPSDDECDDCVDCEACECSE